MTANSPDHPHELPADTEYPSELKITSTPYEQHKADALDRVKRWESGEDVPHVVNFQDASRLQRVLTPRRLELIRSLLEGSADSIRDLADRLDRDVRQVHDDVDLLNEYGIVRFHEDGTAKGPFIPYETISIEVELSKPTGEPSDSTASA